MLRRLINHLLYRYLKYCKYRETIGVDIEVPIRLMEEYRDACARDSGYVRCLVKMVTGDNGAERDLPMVEAEYKTFLQALDEKARWFDDKPFQLGGLDLEIPVIVGIVLTMNDPEVLEVGVANGYSTANLLFALSRAGGRLTSLDLPCFSNDLKIRWRSRALNGRKAQKTGTLGDLRPGGVIPKEKYAGWLVPMALRERVRHISIVGDAFNILPDIGAERYDLAVFDAMKQYDACYRMFQLIADRLKPNGICAVDGYWVNPAFADFCRQNGFPSWSTGRIGIFRKTHSHSAPE